MFSWPRYIDYGRAARAVMLAMLGATAAIFGGFVASFGFHRLLTPMPAVKRWFDIGGEGNLPTWWNSLLLAVVAMLGLVSASTSVRSDERRAWYLIAMAATYLSIDEATVLHERLRRLTELSDLDPPTYAWLIPGALLALVASGVLVRVGRSLPSPAGARLGAALAVYAFAALGLEAVGGVVRDHLDTPWLFTIVLSAEEGLEIVACILGVGAVIDDLNPRRHNGQLVVGPAVLR